MKSQSFFCALAIFIITALTTACVDTENTMTDETHSGAIENDTAPIVISGSIGDGPVIGAYITITDNNDEIIAFTTSDDTANFTVTVPGDTDFPVTISATGGTDVVTGAPPDFYMYSVAENAGNSRTNVTANINPFSTLIVKTALAMQGGLSPSNLSISRQNILHYLNFGIDTALMPDPITTPVTEQNVANIVKSSEAFAEAIRRTSTALKEAGTFANEDQVISALSADMANGLLDGVGADNADPIISATANVVSGQVLIETLSNNLNVNGIWATNLLDNAVLITMPTATETTADVVVNQEILAQTKRAISAAQAVSPSEALTNISTALDSLTPGTNAIDVVSLLTVNVSDDFNIPIESIVLLPANQINAVNAVNAVANSDYMESANLHQNTSPSEVAPLAEVSPHLGSTVSDANAGSFGNAGSGGNTDLAKLTINTSDDFNSPIESIVLLPANQINAVNAVANSDYTESANLHQNTSPSEVTPHLGNTVSDANTGSFGSAGSGGNTEPANAASYNDTSNPLEKLTISSVIASDYDKNRMRIPENAIDGNSLTKWTTLGMPQWISLDVGNTKLISKVRMLFYGGNRGADISYKISVSDDNKSWSNIASEATFSLSPEWTELSFTPVEAKYLHLSLNSKNATDYANLYEIELYGSSHQNSINNSSQNRTLSWNKNPGEILGYIVYSGSEKDGTFVQFKVIDLASGIIDPDAPKIHYDPVNELGYQEGDNICFKVRAYDSDGLSGWSQAVCSNAVANSDYTESANLHQNTSPSEVTPHLGNTVSDANTGSFGSAGSGGNTEPANAASYNDTSNPLEKLTISSVIASDYDKNRMRIPENAIDGNSLTKWTTLGMPQWISLDVGNTKLISKVRMLFYGGNRGADISYKISVSDDNKSWSNIASEATFSLSPEWTELSFTPVEAKYLHLSLNSKNATDYANLYEIELYGSSHQNSINNSSQNRTLSWNKNPGEILGYIVYSGSEKDGTFVQFKVIDLASGIIDPDAPKIHYDPVNELGYQEGDNICFKVRAYDSDGLSGWSQAVCSSV